MLERMRRGINTPVGGVLIGVAGLIALVLWLATDTVWVDGIFDVLIGIGWFAVIRFWTQRWRLGAIFVVGACVVALAQVMDGITQLVAGEETSFVEGVRIAGFVLAATGLLRHWWTRRRRRAVVGDEHH